MASILVIGDDPDIRSLLKRVLKTDGHEVVGASNWEQGITLYRSLPTDLIITDIFVPKKECLETILLLRKLHPDVKIIAMSGGASAMTNSTVLFVAERLGAILTMPRSIGKKQLLDAVRDVLDSGRHIQQVSTE